MNGEDYLKQCVVLLLRAGVLVAYAAPDEILNSASHVVRAERIEERIKR